MKYKIPLLNHIYAAEALIKKTDSQFSPMEDDEIKRRLKLALEELEEAKLVIDKIIMEMNNA